MGLTDRVFPRRSDRPFTKLRSFHLSPIQVTFDAAKDAEEGNTVFSPGSAFSEYSSSSSVPSSPLTATQPSSPPLTPSRTKARSIKATIRSWAQIIPRNKPVPIPAVLIVSLCLLLSLLFIIVLACVFRGADAGEPPFRKILNDLADNHPGIVLIGDNVDVDVDEPSITIRWSIIACGESFILAGSNGTHASSKCGLPSMPLSVFFDGSRTPTATYDPQDIPYTSDSGTRRNVQSLIEFDSEHALDVDKAPLYPFDTYHLTSSVRIVSSTPGSGQNDSVPVTIRKIATVDVTTNFAIRTEDVESYADTLLDGKIPTRDFEMLVRRPTEVRLSSILLFAMCWVLTHICIGYTVLANRCPATHPILKHLALTATIPIILPQLRAAMPDSPGLDGFLIDTIGFFPQMIICAICLITVLLSAVSRDIDVSRTNSSQPPRPPTSPPPASRALTVFTGTPPSSGAFDDELTPSEMNRLVKHLKGEYVFPPISSSPALERKLGEIEGLELGQNARRFVGGNSHRRVRTMVRVVG